MEAFKVVIPARYASSRLHAKPLQDIAGKPMVVRVAEQAVKSGAEQVIIATDHSEIADAACSAGYEVVMTKVDHISGTDRIAEVAEKQGWLNGEIIVNVQGDEPLIEPQLIAEVARQLVRYNDASMSTVCHSIHDLHTMLNPNVVKVVLDRHGYALYFSRAPIPFARDAFSSGQGFPDSLPVYRHIGIYGYRASFLREYSTLVAADIEKFEALEQLRVLWHGHKINVLVTDHAPVAGVDTQLDLDRVREIFSMAE